MGDSGQIDWVQQTSSSEPIFTSWCITVPNGQDVSLEFYTLDIKDCFDAQLNIHNGHDSTGSLVATYCGKNATLPKTLRSTGSNVYILFQSCGKTNVDLKFGLTYTAVMPSAGITY